MIKGRLNLIFFSLILFSALIFWRLFSLQVVQGDYWRALAQGLNFLNFKETVERGEIFFNDREPLVINKNFSLVFTSFPELQDLDGTAEILSQILQMPQETVSEKIKKNSLYSFVKDSLTEEEALKIKEANIPGVHLKENRKRYFPQETMASQAVGFTDADFQGRYGLEEHYNDVLKEGKNLVLTLDYNVQFRAEELLKKAGKNLKIGSGSILVMDPNSGKILALANFPNFDPNNYQEYAQKGDLALFQNSATQKIFEPGSVFKPVTMAGALEEEKITPQTAYQDPGEIKIGGYKILNYEGRTYPGQITMTEVLEKSINTGAVFAERQLGHNLFLKYIERFGFFGRTGIDLNEIYSENKELKKGYEINFATASFGQGIEITQIQLVRAFAAIANGGRLVKPYLVDKINDKTTAPELSQPIISVKTASQLTAMLTSVVENGFSRKAKIPGYHIAGKTGTAQVPVSGKYSLDKTVQSFIGFFPAFNPQFVALVKLDNPQSNTAEYSALPVFRDLAEYIINLYQIPPDYEIK